MSGLEFEKGSIKNTKYGFLTIFGLNDGGFECGSRKRRKVELLNFFLF
jgi:hypothetical protein